MEIKFEFAIFLDYSRNKSGSSYLFDQLGDKNCGNFRIFLTLRFYVKSISVNQFEAPKTANVTV